LSLPQRVPILYLIISVLVLVSVVPMYFYSRMMVAGDRYRLKTNERILQNTITRALSEEITQRMTNLDAMLGNMASAIVVTSGGDVGANKVNAPELRALLERFVSSSNDLAYATLLNTEGKGQSVGRITPDEFLQRELFRGFNAARDSRTYNGQAMSIGAGAQRRTVVVVTVPVLAAGRFIGMLGTAIDLGFLSKSLDGLSQGGLLTYVVDREGRMVMAPESAHYATGKDMSKLDIVKSFEDTGGKAQVIFTSEFAAVDEKQRRVEMLGTYSPVPALGWAVIAQKPQYEAYSGVYEMQQTATLLALLMVFTSALVGILAARRLTEPLQQLTEKSHAIARGDFSQRVMLKSRTEIGDLANTFNLMSADLERFVRDLKRAAEENRHLFLNSIQMLAGAVDEKDPYTRGHSDRVTKYSVLIAKELALIPDTVEKIRISAQLHDVGKIGIEDRILKKPGALTPEEYEVMKSHTVRGANILRSIEQLREMIPGIELHHESMDGKGYPYGLKGEDIPLSARIIAVADTFDAMTTNRPYQAAQEPEYAIKIINTLGRNRLDPKVVAALTRIFERGELRMHRSAATKEAAAAAAQVKPSAESAVAFD
jgi:HD-GYP domain-containing protein (c-di-GMP phosphodiesterase class II)